MLCLGASHGSAGERSREFIVSAVSETRCTGDGREAESFQSVTHIDDSNSFSLVRAMSSLISGGYCDGVPPLPIPNREVKPACADGTAMQCGRVGHRLLFKTLRKERKLWITTMLLQSFFVFQKNLLNHDYR